MAPPQANANPYASPSFDYQPVDSYEDVAGGSYGLGIVVGFILGVIGLLIVYIAGKPETKRGAVHGFLGALVLNLFLFVLGAMAG